MTISVLLRLLTDGRSEGRVAGNAEIVETGETVVFKDQEEMLAFLRRASTPGEPHASEIDASRRPQGRSRDA